MIVELRALLADSGSGPAHGSADGPTDGPAPGPELLAAARARLGALLGARWAEGREERDRWEAVGLLRGAREGEALEPSLRTAAARDLLVLLLGPYGVAAPVGLDLLRDVLDASVPVENGGPGLIESVGEVEALTHELAATRRGGMPPELGRFLALQTRMQRALAAGDVSTLLGLFKELEESEAAVVGPLAPLIPMLRRMLPTSTEGLTEADLEPTTAAQQRELLPLIAMMTESSLPGTLSAEQLAEVVRSAGRPGAETGLEINDALVAMARTLLGGRTGDPAQYEEALRLLGVAEGEGREDPDLPWFVRGVLPGVLGASGLTGGSRQDQEAAERLLAGSLEPGSGPLVTGRPPDRPGARDLLLANRHMLLMSRITAASGIGDVPALETLIGEALDLLDEQEDEDRDPTPPGEPADPAHPTGSPGHGSARDASSRAWRTFMPLFLLGYAHLARASATSETEALRSAGHYLEQAYESAEAVPFLRSMMDALWAPVLALTTVLDPDPARVRTAVERARASLLGHPVVTDQRVRTRTGIAMALTLQHRATGDPALLDEALGELEAARGELTSETTEAAGVLYWELARARAARAARNGDAAETAGAVADARASLRAVAAQVLLQEGVRHGLETARGGAERALVAAAWAVRTGHPEGAVACLEAGRALVLGAAAVTATVPERLTALGEDDLAARWRASRPGAAEEPEPGVVGGLLGGPTGEPELPSGLRRRVLDRLRGAGDGPVDEEPERTAARLRLAVSRSGADALVYLVPGTAGEEGRAVFLVPDRAPWALTLPALSEEGRGPVAGYLAAASVRHTARRGAERWETALEELCDWAGAGVMGPLLTELGLWERGLREAGLLADPGPAAPVRLVLVACGNLGAVPWQAGRVPVPRESRAAGAPDTVRVCEVAVLTYAASGSEFRRVVRARRAEPGRGQALVCVPDGLDTAEDEVLALRDAFYPRAVLFGQYDTLHEVVPEGTPAEVLGLFGARGDGPARPAVVHLVCHGTAGPDPAASVLELAAPDGAGSGRLSVTELLDIAPAPEAEGRPLVVLSACETDLSTRDHDEALTLTTAFAHGAAADAVGSRWLVDDAASAVLMTVFHHHLAAGAAPADALRAAQRWMLAPAAGRPGIPALTPHLRRIAGRPELTGTAAWGAFIHQGSPAPRPRPEAPAPDRPLGKESTR
ncbi:CHAT domain-containing protein [Streptomyces sp. NPDC097619]|uniref:CHAT domain-containing protein n=1 Tax=Streptomyces sp. NPDC097619 TaxID=3157228 RepID=UPI003322EABC